MIFLSPYQFCKSATRPRVDEPGPGLQFPQITVSLNPDYETRRHQEVPQPTTVRPVSYGVHRWPRRGDSPSGLSLCDASLVRCRGFSGPANGPSLRDDHRLAASHCSTRISSASARRRLTRSAESPATLCSPAHSQVDETVCQIWHPPVVVPPYVRATASSSCLL